MKEKFKSIIFKILVAAFEGLLKSNRDKIVTAINKKINLPFVSEEKERALLSELLDTFLDLLESVLPEIVKE